MWDFMDQHEAQEAWFNRYDYAREAFADPDLFLEQEPPYIRGVIVITAQDKIEPVFVSPNGIEEIPF